MPRAVGVTKLKAPQKGWRARYYDAAGNRHQRVFATQGEGIAWRTEQLAAVASGRWVDPRGGAVTVREYAEKWRQGAGHRGQSVDTVERRLRVHVYPALGDRPLAEVRHSEVKAWVARLDASLAPWTAYGVHAVARSVFNSAVADKLLVESPFARVPLKGVARPEAVVPMTVAEVRAVIEASLPPYRGLFALAAGTGMRGGELRGLCLADLDLLRRTVRVERQLVETKVEGKATRAFGPPKTARSRRSLDVPLWVVDELAAHLQARPAVEQTLPVVDTPRVTEHTGALVFTTMTGRPILRSGLAAAWHRSVERAGLPARKGGPHHLRHHVASLLIAAGESVKVVQAQLGHATAAETWDTYSHLFPDTEGRVRGVLDAAWQADGAQAGHGDRLGEGRTGSDQQI